MAATTAMTGVGVLALEPAPGNGSDKGTGDEGLFAQTLEQVRQGGSGMQTGDGAEQHEAPPEGAAESDTESAVVPHAGVSDGEDEGREGALEAADPAAVAMEMEQHETIAEDGENDALGLFLAQLATTPTVRNVAADGVADEQMGGLGLLPGGKKLPLLPPSSRLDTLKLRSFERLQGAGSEVLKGEATLKPVSADGQEEMSQEGGAPPGDEGQPNRLTGLHNALKSAMANQNPLQGSRPDRLAAMVPEALRAAEPEALQPASGSQPGTVAATSSGIRAANAALPSFNVPQPMQHKGWEQAMGERMVWMARNSIQQAKLQLNPRDMGPVEVRVSLNQDQATVHFVAQQSATRDVLEQALPRLREMFQESGLNLAQSEVSQHDFRRRGEGSAESGGSAADDLADEALAEQEGLVTESPLPDSAVDYYA